MAVAVSSELSTKFQALRLQIKGEIKMKCSAYARNNKTGERVHLGDFQTRAEAWYNIQNNLEWEPDDIPADWSFEVEII